MKVIFVINTFLFRMRVKANWNLPHLPRIGERISQAKNDFNKFNDNESDLEGNFKAWVYDVICEANIIESIHYVTSPENYREILPEIYLSDFRN